MSKIRRLLQPGYRALISEPSRLFAVFIWGTVWHLGVVFFANWLEWSPVIEGLTVVTALVVVAGVFFVLGWMLDKDEPEPSEHEQVLVLLREIADRLPGCDD